MARIIPFPLARRRGLILRQAAWFAEQSRHAAETNLLRQLQVQREALLRRGVAQDVVEQECFELERAIRVQATRIMFAPGGAA